MQLLSVTFHVCKHLFTKKSYTALSVQTSEVRLEWKKTLTLHWHWIDFELIWWLNVLKIALLTLAFSIAANGD